MADQCYYLPAHSCRITATALVRLFKTQDNIIQAAKLVQLTLDPTITIEPDTRELVVLTYEEDWFASDEIELGTTPKGLLENISSVAEDRIGQIVAHLTDVVDQPPGGAAEKRGFRRGEEVEALVTEIVEYTRTFDIGVEEAGDPVIRRQWLLPLKGTVAAGVPSVDASFSLSHGKNLRRKRTLAGNEYAGILTRPLVQQTWEVTATGLQEVPTFTCLVPDRYSVINVPIKRSFFIRREQQPKLSNGLLIQNRIVKPSEAESLITIPIKIAKAVFSIPAQLFQFKIMQVRQETEFTKARKDLAQARQDLAKLQAPALQTGGGPGGPGGPGPGGPGSPGSGQQQAGVVPPPADTSKDNTPQEEFPPLGKLPATVQPPAGIRMADIRQRLRAAALPAGADLTEFPESRFWNDKFNGPWLDYRNVKGGIHSCVPAAAAHMITSWTSLTRTQAIVPNTDEIIKVYTRESGFNPATGKSDAGCSLSVFMDNWVLEGVAGRLISAYALLSKSKDELKFGLFWFGPCVVGLKMPQTAQLQTDRWQVVSGDATHSANPDTWGGHAVAAIGYDADGVLVISWGRPIRMDWSFYDKYYDESYAVLTDDWLMQGQHSPDPANKPLAALQTALKTLQRSQRS